MIQKARTQLRRNLRREGLLWPVVGSNGSSEGILVDDEGLFTSCFREIVEMGTDGDKLLVNSDEVLLSGLELDALLFVEDDSRSREE